MANISSTLWHGPRGYFSNGSTEVDTFTCQHCNKVVFCCDPVTKQPKRADDCGGICNNCKGNICPNCVNDGRCTPLERKIELIEERGRRQREYGF